VSEDPHTLTGTYGKEGADEIRAFARFRKQWSKTSISVLVAVLGICGSVIGELYLSQERLATRVVVLETEVVPDLKLKEKIAEHDALLALHGARLDNLERNYDFAREHAGDAPVPKARRK
jgi:chromosome condensin MukBEF MukE localization factor